jgi:hypothetical protein
MREFKAAHRAWNSNGAPSHEALVGSVTARIEIHVARSLGGCLFAEVDERDAAVCHADEHESAAAEVSGDRVRDCQREADGYSGVHGVAAGFEHSDTNVRSQRFFRDNHALARVAWFAAFDSLADQERQEEKQRGKSRTLALLQQRHRFASCPSFFGSTIGQRECSASGTVVTQGLSGAQTYSN